MPFTWNRDVVVRTFDDSAPPQVADGVDWDLVGQMLTKLASYFIVNLRQHPGLASAAGQPMSNAIAAYGSRSADDPYGLIRQVVNLVKTAQQSDAAIRTP